MVGLLKVPKLGGVKKGWVEQHVYLSNARLFVCPLVDGKPSIIPAQVIDIKDPNFYVSKVRFVGLVPNPVANENKRLSCFEKKGK